MVIYAKLMNSMKHSQVEYEIATQIIKLYIIKILKDTSLKLFFES